MKNLFILIMVFCCHYCLIFAQDTTPRGMTENIYMGDIYKVGGHLYPVKTNCILEQNVRGTTESIFSPSEIKVSGTLEPVNVINNNNYPKKEKEENKILTDYSNWLFADSVFINSYVSGGKNIGVKLDVKNRKFELIMPNYDLTAKAKDAIARVPKWIRHKFSNTLSRLTESRMNAFGDIIINAEGNLVDEIAFSIAYSSPAFLRSNYCFPELFLENAQLIYSHDQDLDYVEIVDYGVPDTDEDYYSTVKYWKIDSEKGKIQIEVPKDIYYMYVVHPKITDEIPAYIDPKLYELNTNGWHTNNIAVPPRGVFWRNFLYTHTEKIPLSGGAMYPILKDSVSVCDVLWDDNNEEKQAVKAINKWILDVLDFTSKQERPHQPVRIYNIHIGRCGEHEDFTAAVARTCLIPCRGISAHSIDHVWNEFWDEKWEQWEPVNNSYKRPLAYITWDTLGAVTARHSCGVHEFVTDIYNDKHNFKYTITALDASNKPIDGALLWMYSLGYSNYYKEDRIFRETYGITDSEGKYTFVLGKDKLYYIRLQSSLGNNPPENNRVLHLNTSYSEEGQDLEYNINAPRSKASVLNEIPLPDDNKEDYVVKVKFSVEKQVINWKLNINDLSSETTYCDSEIDHNINLLILDEDNYDKCIRGYNYEAYRQFNLFGELDFDVPADKDWYIILNNELINNLQLVEASFALYQEPATSVEDKILGNSELLAYPNPFSKTTIIQYNISNPAFMRLNIFDYLGNKIRNIEKFQDAGMHQEIIDAENLFPGMYFYTIEIGDRAESGKLLLIK